jgi:hypothetical protein
MELLAKITIAHEEGFSMVLAEGVKKNERSVGCNGEKSEAQSGVSMAGSDENENEDEDEDFLHRRILDSIVNWHGCEEEKVGNENENGVSLTFKKEEMGDREIRKEMDVEIVRCNVNELHVEKSEDQSRRIAIDDFYVERDTGSVREEEKGNYNENDEDSLQRRILDSIVNWPGLGTLVHPHCPSSFSLLLPPLVFPLSLHSLEEALFFIQEALSSSCVGMILMQMRLGYL